MTDTEAKRLKSLFDQGHTIIITSVHGDKILDDIIEKDGDIFYIYTPLRSPLASIARERIRVLKAVPDWYAGDCDVASPPAMGNTSVADLALLLS